MQRYGLYSSVKEVVHAPFVAPETLKRYADGSIAFLYLDHCRRSRKADLMRAWWPKIRAGGRLCGDDAQAPGVKHRLKTIFRPPGAVITWMGAGHWCAMRPAAAASQHGDGRGSQE